MNDWELLNIAKTQDKAAIFAGLVQKVADKDFKTDLPEIFRYIKGYHQIIASIERQSMDEQKYFPVKVGFSNDEIILPYMDGEIYQTPEQLINYFTEIYGNLATRFNILYWKSALANAKTHSIVETEAYCLPIVHFLSEHSFVKSDVLLELKKSFPILKFFETEEWDQLRSTEVNYGYVEFLINVGNVELDLQIDALLEHAYTSGQIDSILSLLARSMRLVREKDFAGAFNVLSGNIPEEAKPLLMKQREANLLFAAVVLAKQEEARGHFTNVLNQSLQRFPGDAHLLYLRAAFLFHSLSADEALEEIIATLKIDPTNKKCFFLLGKAYLTLDLNQGAYEIFQHISEFEPLNLEYVACQAIALQKVLEEQRQIAAPGLNKAAYMEQVFQLIDINLYEEIQEIPESLPEDSDLIALRLYAKVCEHHYYEDRRDFAELYKALEIAEMPELVLRLVRKQISFHPTFAEIAQQKEFLLKYLPVFPDDDVINFHMGSYYLQAEEYPEALEYYQKANRINPENMDTYLGVARAAEYLKEYQMAIDHIRVYLEAHNYDPVGYEILARCAINIQNYLLAYRSYRWIVQIRTQVTPMDQFYLVNTLAAYTRNTSINLAKNNLFMEDLHEVILLFESLPKGEEFRQHPNGRVAYFWAAVLCNFAKMEEKGLEFANEAIKISADMGVKNLEDIAKYKAGFLMELGRYQENIQFLLPYVAYLQKNLPQEKFNIFNLGFYIAASYEKLEQIDEAYQWRMLNIERYYEIEAHDKAWLEDYIINFFDQCLNRDNLAQIKEVGNLYLLAIEEPFHNHIYVCYWLADSYAKEGNITASTEFFQKAITYGSQFPEDYQDMVESAKSKLVS